MYAYSAAITTLLIDELLDSRISWIGSPAAERLHQAAPLPLFQVA